MSPARRALARSAVLGLVALALAITQPVVLIGLPLAVMVVACGPRNARSLVAVAVVVFAAALLGERTGLWWFERGWPLLLGGAFVWVASWRPDWSFLSQALAAMLVAVTAAAAAFVISPGAWLDVDALMAARVSRAVGSTASLLGDRLDETATGVMREIARLQMKLFPGLLGVSSLAALGSAVAFRGWLAGDGGRPFGRLRAFRFNDHLVWVALAGLALILAPVGEIAHRIGGNALFFMGALYLVRGLAVLLSLMGGISVVAGVVGGVVAVIVYPLAVLILGLALLVGVGDTWLNVRQRVRADAGGDGE